MNVTSCDCIQPRILRKWNIVICRNVVEKIWKRVFHASEVWILAILSIVHDVQVTHLIVVGRTAIHTYNDEDTFRQSLKTYLFVLYNST